MSIPFTLDQFLDVFRRYNNAVWPAQTVLLVFAMVTAIAVLRFGEHSSRWVSAALAVLWIWAGVAYHFAFFRSINPAATVFAALFVAQGLVFVWLGVVRRAVRFQAAPGWRRLIGSAVIAYALALYPLLGIRFGHTYPAAPTFGAPCPTTIFTFGLLVWTVAPRSKMVMAIPTVWSVVGLSAALQLRMWEDFGLAISACIALAFTFVPSGRGVPAPKQSGSLLQGSGSR